MKRLIVTGAGGMLGADVTRQFSSNFKVTALTRKELDITDKKAVRQVFKHYRPEIVINCAAFTRVDDCESMKETAFSVNAEGPGILASACRDSGALLVHISTDYVFDGSKKSPWKEDEPKAPLNIYGESKLQGEKSVEARCDNYLIIRTSWLFGLNGPNFITTMLDLSKKRDELSVVNDQEGSPTSTRDLAWGIKMLVMHDLCGVFHCCNSGSCTWFDLCRFVFEKRGIKGVTLKPVPSESFPRPAARPEYSVLDTSRFKKFTGRKMRPWQQAVSEYLSDLEKGATI